MKRGSGKITWGHLGKMKTYKHALQTERPTFSPEDRARIVAQKMKPYDSVEAAKNTKVVFAGAAYLSGDTPTPSVTPTYTPTPTPSSTGSLVDCTWSGTTSLWGGNSNDWNDCAVVPSISSTPVSQTPTPSMTRTPQVTPTHTPTPTPTQPGTGGFIDYFDAAYYDGGDSWNSLTTSNRFELLNSPTLLPDFGGMISFDGVDDYAVANANIIPSTTAWTLEFWYRWNSASCSYSINRNFIDGQTTSPTTITNNFIDGRDCFGNVSWMLDGGPELTGYNAGTGMTQVVYAWSGGTMDLYIDGVFNSQGNGFTYTHSLSRLSQLSTNGVDKSSLDWAIIRTYGSKLTSTDVLNNFNQIKSRFGL